MKKTMKLAERQQRLGRALRMSALCLALLGCGGGVGTGGTGTFTYGPVTGFGSVIVNGIRFDENQARIEDDNGGSRSRDVLKLGSMVAIESDTVSSDASGRRATASVVRVGSVVVGPVTSVDAGNGTLTVLGQTVRVVTTTVLDDALGSVSTVTAGTVIEVHGFVDAALQSIVATRVERAASTATYKLRGTVTSLDTAAGVLRIGAGTFDYRTAAGTPADLAVGATVTLLLRPQASGGNPTVQSFGTARLSQPDSARDQADIRGLVSAVLSGTRFVLNDTTVDTSVATFPDERSGLVTGARVKAEGRFEAGILMASKVEIDSDEKLQIEGIDLRGAIESVAPAASAFRLRGNTVFYGNAGVRFKDGSVADLTVGRQVRVRGILSADRLRVVAREIEF